ncbi:hypothetical protein CDD82_6501 [Ophiocordyceps australis]|uniref:Vesicle-mediated transporter Vid24 n=1 Tax=Ophiocordyceps australis TaxID=1399860 RepID=A0A2C5YWN6_9HYPO|nr:hypothetical protein CDD82_6501 [Ophiocordyceps australis]
MPSQSGHLEMRSATSSDVTAESRASQDDMRHHIGHQHLPLGPNDVLLLSQAFHSPSSRATTVSPGPPLSSTTPVVSFPPSIGPDVPDSPDSLREASAESDEILSRMTSVASRQSSVHQSLAFDFDDAFVYDEEDDNIFPFPSMGTDFPSCRSIAVSPSSFLRPGSRFHGTQQSERQVYEVQVEIKHVDLRESFLCGYLRIQGLTEDHPTLTTFFEGEIIGTKYGFITQHEDWGASVKTDLSHWGKFGAFQPYKKTARKGPVIIPDVAQKDTIFMRWKEHFLVPDHRVRTITGASFEGFYYICFNQLKGEVNGIYFHSKSEK